jgi:hypothetical protein
MELYAPQDVIRDLEYLLIKFSSATGDQPLFCFVSIANTAY